MVPQPDSASPSSGDVSQASAGEFIAPSLQGRSVYLRSIGPQDTPFLQQIETSGEIATRWRLRGSTPGPERWAQVTWANKPTALLGQIALFAFPIIGLNFGKPVWPAVTVLALVFAVSLAFRWDAVKRKTSPLVRWLILIPAVIASWVLVAWMAFSLLASRGGG